MPLLPRTDESNALDLACINATHDEAARRRLASLWRSMGFTGEADFLTDATIGPRAVGYASIHNLTVRSVVEVANGTAIREGGEILAEHFGAIDLAVDLAPDNREQLTWHLLQGANGAATNAGRVDAAYRGLRAHLGDDVSPPVEESLDELANAITALSFSVGVLSRAIEAIAKLNTAGVSRLNTEGG